ncbi:hypothetical protein PCANC_28087 [Puccinia coronata f. sp. avenae]|uniref:Transmembrane protein n=1 Tax=Puccinia coronata f. sp. avenae TaxID=200324 RepID=A0A2N5S2E2_9BASI|nr:hypothetical protein PCANC_28087 [Puccinia coronata f. sp. avenae]
MLFKRLLLLSALSLQAAADSNSIANAVTHSNPTSGLERRASGQSLATAWASISVAVKTCLSTYKASGTTASVAVSATVTLQTALSAASSDCDSGCDAVQASVSASVSACLKGLQDVISTGLSAYASVKTQLTDIYASFSAFVQVAGEVIVAVGLDLNVFINGLGLNLSIYVSIGINITSIIGGIIGIGIKKPNSRHNKRQLLLLD